MEIGFEGLIFLLPFRRWRHDFKLGCTAPIVDRPFSLRYGYITKGADRASWYILIGLPSYSMRVSTYRQAPRWCQLFAVFTADLPAGHGAWALEHLEVT